MMNRCVIRLSIFPRLIAALVLVSASPAHAQFQPRPLNDPATGEAYHVEAAAGLWFPTADVVVSSESLGIPGTPIDFRRDFNLQDKRFPELRLVLRPSQRHKFRLQYIPIKYEATATLQRNIVFNGIAYPVGRSVTTNFDWKAYRLGYEYDVVSNDQGFAGVVLDVKYTDVFVQLAPSQGGSAEFAEAKAPIPAIGAIARYYLAPNLSITGEITGFKLGWLPSRLVKDSSGHYVDLDVYATLNFTNNIGVQAGYRSLDLGYVIEADTGALTMKGLYFSLVVRR